MSWWPFSKTEKRESSYSEAVGNLLFSSAAGKSPLPHLTGAVESAAGLLGRGLSMAKVTGQRTEGLTPEWLAHVGRQLVVSGESLHVIEIINGEVKLFPVAHFDVYGNSMSPDAWVFRCDVFSPSGSRTLTRPAEGVIHCKWSFDSGSPWRGIGPLARGRLTSGLLAALEGSLLNQAKSPTGQIVPVPSPGTADDEATDPLSELKTDLSKIGGGVMLTETTQGGFGDGRGVSPSHDWAQNLIGFSPSKESLPIREAANLAVMSACGIPPSLTSGRADGTAQRAGLERFLRLTLQPIGNLIADELTKNSKAPLPLTFPRLEAAISRHGLGALKISSTVVWILKRLWP